MIGVRLKLREVNKMAEPKLKTKRTKYFEHLQSFIVEINNKEIEVSKYDKQDEQFNDYESEINVIDKEKVLTEEEHEEVYEFVEGLE